MNMAGRAATVMLAGVFVIASGAIPVARVHPPGMDVTKPQPPHYVLLRRKPERDPGMVMMVNSHFFVVPACWECRPRSAPYVYSPWSRWNLSAGNKLITLSAEGKRP